MGALQHLISGLIFTGAMGLFLLFLMWILFG